MLRRSAPFCMAVLVVLVSTADAALVYAPIPCAVSPPPPVSDARVQCAGPPSLDDGLPSARPGDPNETRSGAPHGEYIDMLTNIVYGYDGNTLTPSGISTPQLGYIYLSAFQYGHYSGDPVTDACGGIDTGQFCGGCPTPYCMVMRVQIVGNHHVKVHETWRNLPSDDGCVPAHYLEYNIWDYGDGSDTGGVVTFKSDYQSYVPPLLSCGIGTYSAALYIDGVPAKQVEVEYGRNYEAPPCTDQVQNFLWWYGVVNLTPCVPCWPRMLNAASAPGSYTFRSLLICQTGIDIGVDIGDTGDLP